MYDNHTPTKVTLSIAEFHNDLSVRRAVLNSIATAANGRTPGIDMGGHSSLEVVVKRFGVGRIAEVEFYGMDHDFAAEFGSAMSRAEGIKGVVISDGECWNPCIRVFGFHHDSDEQYNLVELVHEEVVSKITRALKNVVVNRDL